MTAATMTDPQISYFNEYSNSLLMLISLKNATKPADRAQFIKRLDESIAVMDREAARMTVEELAAVDELCQTTPSCRNARNKLKGRRQRQT
jgi:hypothetical protein